MIIFHKKNTAYELSVPILDGATPRLFNSGISPTFVAYYRDIGGSWTLHTIADSFTEIASTGFYVLSITAAELNHDRVFIKYSGGATQLDAGVVFDLSPNFASFTLGPISSSLNSDNITSNPVNLSVFKKEAKSIVLAILDSNGVAVDMSSKTLRFTVETIADAPVSQFGLTGGSIVVSGDDSNIVTVAVTSINTDLNAIKYQWRLWDTGAEIVWQHGIFEVVDTSESST